MSGSALRSVVSTNFSSQALPAVTSAGTLPAPVVQIGSRRKRSARRRFCTCGPIHGPLCRHSCRRRLEFRRCGRGGTDRSIASGIRVAACASRSDCRILRRGARGGSGGRALAEDLHLGRSTRIDRFQRRQEKRGQKHPRLHGIFLGRRTTHVDVTGTTTGSSKPVLAPAWQAPPRVAAEDCRPAALGARIGQASPRKTFF